MHYHGIALQLKKNEISFKWTIKKNRQLRTEVLDIEVFAY